MSPWRIHQIATHLKHGAVIAYPTDTIWGLGCHPQHLQSVRRIQHIKQRSLQKALILLCCSVDYLPGYVDDQMLQQHADRIKEPQARPVTWVCKAHPLCPPWLTGGLSSIAIRISDMPPIRQLSAGIRAPLVSTSANISGRPNARNALAVHKLFRQQVDHIVTGYDCGGSQASRIIDLQSGKILRA
ncbi:MAG: L-threonylcarbamoyladenylate synthase [Gammaproteobacteria bacterium]|nr:L-threonylcarbamoyladenylate synthase [Gammaproteobacteria bacterium]